MQPYFNSDDITIYQGDALSVLKELPAASVQMCVTSPPYWAQRQYLPTGHANASKMIGLEPALELYIERLVEIFAEVRRILRKDGSLWLNLGDKMWGGKGQNARLDKTIYSRKTLQRADTRIENILTLPGNGKHPVLKAKDMCGLPWRVAFALQADGWWLRRDIIWSKVGPMPESVTDRPSSAHEYIFLLTKSAHYYYDRFAIREPLADSTIARYERGWNGNEHRDYPDGWQNHIRNFMADDEAKARSIMLGRNLSSVWTFATASSENNKSNNHYAIYPCELVRRCLLLGTSDRGCCSRCGNDWIRQVEPSAEYAKLLGKGYHDHKNDLEMGMSQSKNNSKNNIVNSEYITVDWKPGCNCESMESPLPCVVLDPFAGSMTTALVARQEGRRSVMIELSEDYCKMGIKRLQAQPKRMAGL